MQGGGWGTLTDLTVDSEKRGEILNSFNFLFQVLSFVNVWALGFCWFVKGNEMGFEGIASLAPLFCVLCGAHPRASANSIINSTLMSYLVLSLSSAGHGRQPQRRKQRVQ